MPAAYTVTVDFLEGLPEGCARAELLPSIVVYRIPKGYILNLDDERELKQAGIYLLHNTHNSTIYVGQADSRANGFGLLGRMTEPHSRNAVDGWDVGYAITNNVPFFFGATELNYLERYFYDKISEAHRFTLLNGNRPHATSVSHSDRIKLDGFTKDAFMLLKCILGLDLSEQIAFPPPPPPPNDIAPALVNKTIYIKTPTTYVDAKAIYHSKERVVVKAGSVISRSNHLPDQQGAKSVARKREELINTGVIRENIFVIDYEFHSVSTAASVIMGRMANGWSEFKDGSGRPIETYRIA